MALHKDFPDSPHSILNPDIRWFPVQSDTRYDFVYVDEEGFNRYKPTSFQDLIGSFIGYKEN
ncbi:MAG: hypothetical protein ABH886_03300 [Candidatus Desantisbacteria bacterium]